MMKKILCLLLALTLALALLPVQSLAVESEKASVLSDTVQFDKDQKNAAAGSLPLSQGNHVLWIDRIGDLPQYAMDFYEWLEENSVWGGALTDPTVGTESVGNGRYHLVTSLDISDEFTFVSKSHLEQRVSSLVDSKANPVYAYIRAAYGAFTNDHPEVFWLTSSTGCGYSYSYSYSNSNGTVKLTCKVQVYFYLQSTDYDIRIEQYQNKQTLAAAMQQFDQAANEILAGCPNTNSYEQVRYLNKVLTQRNCYNSLVAAGNDDAAPKTAWSAISAMTGNVGTQGPVCTAYAKAFKVLCDRLGIPCVLVTGYARDNWQQEAGPHMWNYVQLRGQWYAVDVTWNDPSTGTTAAVSGYESEKWLLLGSSTQVSSGMTFIQSHPVQNDINVNEWVNGPVLSTENCPPMGILIQSGNGWGYYVNNTFTPVTDLVEFQNRLYYVRNGYVDFSYNDFLEYQGKWYYIENGCVTLDSDLLVQNNGYWFYVDNGVVNYDYAGLVWWKGERYYVANGIAQTQATGLVPDGSDWYYIKSGKVASSETTLVKNNGAWFYIKNGKLDWSYTGLCKYSGTWYYVNKGVLDRSYTGLCKYSGTWYYVKKGVLDWSYTGLCKFNGAWYYVKDGKVDFNTTSLVKYNGEWWYVVKGKVASSTTSLVKYNGEWWYVVKGKIASNTTTLVKYNGSWYYIYKGKLASKTTTLVKFSGTWYYVKNGKVDFTYSGRVLYSGKYYTVRSGKVA